MSEPTTIIPLTQGRHAIIDNEDLPLVAAYKWHACKYGHVWYAEGHTPRPNRKTIRMHRIVIGAKKGQAVDHKNGNGLDNRRTNLRICTRSEQSLNCRTDGFRGVGLLTDRKRSKKWYARVRVNGKSVWLGTYNTPEGAAEAFDRLAPRYIGTLYRPNFPEEA